MPCSSFVSNHYKLCVVCVKSVYFIIIINCFLKNNYKQIWCFIPGALWKVKCGGKKSASQCGLWSDVIHVVSCIMWSALNIFQFFFPGREVNCSLNRKRFNKQRCKSRKIKWVSVNNQVMGPHFRSTNKKSMNNLLFFFIFFVYQTDKSMNIV